MKNSTRKNKKKQSGSQKNPSTQNNQKSIENKKNFVSPPSLPLNKKKELAFSIVAMLLPFILLIMLEVVLNLANYGGNLSLFVTGEDDVSHYRMLNRDVGKRYFFMQSTTPRPSKDLFLKEKPANGYRIFVMGGSTTAGFPYANNLMFSRILSHQLQDAFPEKHIEVVNTAMAAINSYTLVDFMDEILDKQPDAILIYAGHNEYYGALGVGSLESLGSSQWLVHAYLKLKRYRIFLALRDLIGKVRQLLGPAASSGEQIDPTATLMERIVAEQEIPYKSNLYEHGKLQFKNNLNKIIEKCGKAHVSLVLSELVCNLRDQAPFSTTQTDTLPTPQAVFQKARELESRSEYLTASKYYTYAKDLDAIRFRASEEFNELIHNLAADHQIPVVPMKKYFALASPNELAGDNLMVDHLHPNIKGYFLMADAFFKTLRQNGLIAAKWHDESIKPIGFYYDNWGITELDSLNATYSLLYLKNSWPFKKNHSANTTLQQIHPKTKVEQIALKALTDDKLSLEMAHVQLANFYEQQGNLNRAFLEYKALYHTIPFEAMFYNRAGGLLVKMNQLDEALPLFKKSIEINNNVYANKWYGQILLTQKKLRQALPYLEKTREADPKDEQMLFNLCQAYILLGDGSRAKEVFSQLKLLFPRSSYLAKLDRLRRMRVQSK